MMRSTASIPLISSLATHVILLNIFLIAIQLPSVVLSQNISSEIQADGVTTTPSNSDDNTHQLLSPPNITLPSVSSPQLQLAIKFAELVAFHERNHEAEYILQVVLPGATLDNNSNKIKSTLESMFLNARSLEMISSRQQQQITNGSMSNSVKVKLKVTIGCDMHYILYPFESHLCSMIVVGDIAPPIFCGQLTAYEFHVKGYLTAPLVPPTAGGQKKQQQQQENQMMMMKKINGPVVNAVHMIMSRTSGMQIYSQMYSPVLLLVMLSFLTLLDATSLPIRIWTSLSMLICSIIITTIFWRDVPRAGQGDVTVLEHYFAIGVGFVFQAFFTNILLHWYTSLALKKHSSPELKNQNNSLANGTSTKNGDVEANNRNNAEFVDPKSGENPATTNDDHAEVVQAYIETLGKFHRHMYFKVLKPAKKQLPIFFLIINVIYWVLVLYLSGGLPKGFQYLPPKTPETAMLCL